MPHPIIQRFALLLFAWALLGSSQATAQTQEDALSYADLLYTQKQYSLAAQQYQLFIRENPRSANVQAAWLRLGECYVQVGQTVDAQTTFRHIVETFKKGAFVGTAAYRIAVIQFNAKDYEAATGSFRTATFNLTDNEAKLQSRFYYGRSLQLTRNPKEALDQYQAVMKAAPPETNPFYERCLLETARLYFDMGETEKALEKFEELASSAKTQEFKEEALVRGGLLAAEAGKPDVSEEFLDQAMKFSDASPWKSLAQVGAVFNAFTRKDYDKVIQIYSLGGTYGAATDSRGKMLLVVGHSFRLKGDLANALKLYGLVEGKYPNLAEGAEAGYRKLQILHQQGATTLPIMAERFALKQKETDKDSKFIDMAYLMKAEWHFNQAETSASGPGSDYSNKQYSLAAGAYGAVRPQNIDEKFRSTRLYKQGWAQVEGDEKEKGISSLTKFIKSYPEDPLAASALAKRGTAYLQLNDHNNALGDFEKLVKDYPNASELEFSMQQVALLHGNKRDIPKMIAAYQALLKKFPETSGKGEAHYWIGAGNYDLEKYEVAVSELRLAREHDRENFGEKATLRLALAYYYLEKVPELAKEARFYIETTPLIGPLSDKKKRPDIPTQVIEYLGKKLYDAKDYAQADFFLSSTIDPEDASKTQGPVWKLVAECRMKSRKFQEAIVAFDNFLRQTQRPSERASAYLNRGKAQLCLRDFEAAQNSARESLRSQKEGRTNAESRILMGDVAAMKGDLEGAAREYLVVSQIFDDRDVTPIALTKAINAYLSLGKREKADELRNQLAKTYPDFKPSEKANTDC